MAEGSVLAIRVFDEKPFKDYFKEDSEENQAPVVIYGTSLRQYLLISYTLNTNVNRVPNPKSLRISSLKLSELSTAKILNRVFRTGMIDRVHDCVYQRPDLAAEPPYKYNEIEEWINKQGKFSQLMYLGKEFWLAHETYQYSSHWLVLLQVEHVQLPKPSKKLVKVQQHELNWVQRTIDHKIPTKSDKIVVLGEWVLLETVDKKDLPRLEMFRYSINNPQKASLSRMALHPDMGTRLRELLVFEVKGCHFVLSYSPNVTTVSLMCLGLEGVYNFKKSRLYLRADRGNLYWDPHNLMVWYFEYEPSKVCTFLRSGLKIRY